MPRVGEPQSPELNELELLIWPAFEFTQAADIIFVAENIPGISPLLAQMRDGLSAELARDLRALILAGALAQVVGLQHREEVESQSVPEFLEWLEALEPQSLLEESELDLGLDSEQLADRMASMAITDGIGDGFPAEVEGSARDRAIALLKEPHLLLRTLVSSLRAFWEGHYRRIHHRQTKEYENQTSFLRERVEGVQADKALEAILDRSAPGAARAVEEQHRVLATPCFYLGPYIIHHHLHLAHETVVEGFDLAHAMRTLSGGSLVVDLESLKALADEIRLRIVHFLRSGERYGQEIVQHIGLTQQAVSRHLRILAGAGVLVVREEGTSKYYSLRAGFLSGLGQRFIQLDEEGQPQARDGSP